MIKTVLLFPIKAAALAAFLYAVGGGWMLLSPSAVLGGAL